MGNTLSQFLTEGQAIMDGFRFGKRRRELGYAIGDAEALIAAWGLGGTFADAWETGCRIGLEGSAASDE